MNANILLGALLVVPAGLFIYFDEKLLISNKVQAKFKINNFFALYVFIITTLVLSTFIVGTLAMLFHISNAFTYAIQSMVIGVLLGLFSNIHKTFRKKKKI